ncbi:MAG: hypothetical protein ACOX7X_06500 [Methanosarcina flavescens]|jgi:hypothetical protein
MNKLATSNLGSTILSHKPFEKNCLSANFLKKSLIKNRRDGVVKRLNGW